MSSMTIEEKYRIAVETLQAISTRGTVAKTDPYLNEWIEAAAMRDMDYAAWKCLKRLGESVLLPSYLKKRAKEQPQAEGQIRTEV